MDEYSPDLFSEGLSSEISIEDLPMLLTSLENKVERGNISQTLQYLLGSFVQQTPIDCLEEKVLQFVLPATLKIFNQIIFEINYILRRGRCQSENDVGETLQINLQAVIDILDNVNTFMIQLSSSGKYKVAQISSVPLNVVDIILETFRHCKTSENEYGNELSSVKDKLVIFFKKGHEAMLSFLSLLHDCITFTCVYEHDLQLLTKLMDKLSSMGEILTGLDVKSMIEQWKGYIRLVQLYSAHLKPVLNVNHPIDFLCSNIINRISKLFSQDNQDIKQLRRNVRISCVELKVVIKLCELFQDNLGDSYQQLLVILLHLNMCSPSYLLYKKVLPSVADDVSKQLFLGACPLLSFLMSDQLFMKVYFRFITKVPNAMCEIKVAYILLTITLTKKIARAEEAVQEEWLKSLNIINVILLTLHYCDTTLCFDLVIDGDCAVDLYEALLINSTILLCNALKPQDFSKLAHLLLMQLLRAHLWPALFSSDLLILLCRFSSDDLCLNVTQTLCDVIINWNKIDIDCPQWIYITQTCGRLFHLLTADSKTKLVNVYPPVRHPTLWKYLPLTDHVKQANNVIQHFISESSDVNSYNSMVCSLSATDNCVGFVCDVEGNTLRQNICLLWQYIAAPVYPWLYHLLSSLVSLTLHFLPSINNKEILFILQCMSDMCNGGDISCQFLTNQLLQNLGSVKLAEDQHQLTLFNKISALFATMLSNKNPLMKICSLETFEFFSSVTSYVVIVSESVVSDRATQNMVSQFLQRLPISTIAPSTREEDFLSQKNNFKHKCERIAENKIASDESLSLVLQRILDDVVFINGHLKQNASSFSEKSLLQKIFGEIKELEMLL